MDEGRTLRAALPVLVGGAAMMTVTMGIRQSFGFFLRPVTADLGIGAADFALALSVQNLVWGIAQPVTGWLAARHGLRPVMLGGALLFLAGLAVMALARGPLGLLLGAGVLAGVALSCTTAAMALAAAARAVPARMRSMTYGVMTGMGSLGALLAAPLGQAVTAAAGWRAGLWALAALAVAAVPGALLAGRADRMAMSRRDGPDVPARTVIRAALARAEFMVMAGAYFVCGMQLLFIATHLPSYLALCGMDAALGVQAFGLIGVTNILGSVFFGWAGGRWPKLALLGGIYLARSVLIAWYFALPPTAASTLMFAGAMGFLWMGVGPLVAGAVGEMFGVRWQPMVQGLALLSHQLGSFAGAWGGGLALDAFGSYTVAWEAGVVVGLAAGTVQVAAALLRPPRGMAAA